MYNHFENLGELEPVSTGEEFTQNLSSKELEGIKAVVFDVYGTLLISDSGDIGGVYHGVKHALAVIQEAGFTVLGKIPPAELGRRIVNQYLKLITDEHIKLKGEGIEFPEVQIDEVWKGIVSFLVEEGFIEDPGPVNHRELAVHFEFQNNPTWPMPKMESVLRELSEKNYNLGIISNAQFFTPMLLKYFLKEESVVSDSLPNSFQGNLQIYSYQEKTAKPGRVMYSKMVEKLREQNTSPSETLYVGNDMLNDIYPAHAEGFRTALFAGDKRSLRLRVDDPRVQGLTPDLIVTELSQITEVLATSKQRKSSLTP